MLLRLLSTSLLAITLLLSTVGCSKKDDPTAAPTLGTGSYKLDGLTITGQATAAIGSVTSGSQTTNLLYIHISDTPTLQSNTKTALLIFQKTPAQPTSAYVLTQINYAKDGQLQSDEYATNTVATLTETSNGVFSGTFSGTASPSGSTIRDGIFTNARLQ
jgi:hypothetical protein